jgi:hypothetical protein
VVQVVQVEDLETEAPGADLGVAASVPDDLWGKSGQTVGPQLVGLAADRGGPVELPRVPQSPPVTVSSGQQSYFRNPPVVLQCLYSTVGT